MSAPAVTDPLSRREALRRALALLGGALIGGPALLAACSRAPSPAAAAAASTLFDADERALMDDIADTILPDTATPGARAAQVGPFMAMMVADCYAPRLQAGFKAGLAEVDRRARAAHGSGFHGLAAAERLALLVALEQEQQAAGRLPQETRAQRLGLDEEVPASMRMFKELTLLGYFTSEIGCTQAQRYIAVPGHYDPCAPYHPGDRAWAPMV